MLSKSAFKEFEMVSLFYLFAYISVRGLKGFIINRMLLLNAQYTCVRSAPTPGSKLGGGGVSLNAVTLAQAQCQVLPVCAY